MIGTSTERWTTLSLANIYERWRTDSGVDPSIANVWTGQKNGLVLSQATSTKRGTIAAGELNGFSALSLDGVDDVVSLASFSHAQPYGALFVMQIAAQSGASNHDIICDFATNANFVLCDTTPRVQINAGATLTVSEKIVNATQYAAALVYFNGVNSFFSINGGVRKYGDVGAGAATRIDLGDRTANDHSTTIKVVEFTTFGALVAGELDKIWNYCRQTYANGVGR